MKKRNKKYNRVEAERRKNLLIIKDYALAFFAADNQLEQDTHVTDYNGKKYRPSEDFKNAITNYCYNWSVMIAVFCIEKGLHTCKMEFHNFTARYYQKDMIEYLNKKHFEFVKKQLDKNVNITGAGWIASPNGRDISEDEAGNIFVKLGAF